MPRISKFAATFINTLLVFCQKPLVPIFILAPLASVLYFWNLGKNSFRDLDEAIFVQVSKEILESGNWITLHLRGVPFFHKPPLMIWLNTFLFGAFGINEFNARFLAALCAVAIILLVYYFVKNSYGVTTGFLASLILIFSPLFLYERGCRSTEEDCLAILLSCAVFYFFWKSRTRQNFLYLSSLCVGLIFLAKSAVAFLPVLSILLFLLVTREYRFYGMRRWIGAAIVFLTVVLPWHIAQFLISGENFFKIYLGETMYFLRPSSLTHINWLTNFISSPVVQRIGQRAEISPLCTPWFYLQTIVVGFYPWSVVFFFALIYVVATSLLYRKPPTEEKRFSLLILCWFLVPLVLLSLLHMRRSFRINIVSPAMAIIMAKFFIDSLRAKKHSLLLIVSFVTTAAVLVNLRIIQYGTPYFTFCSWMDYYLGNFLLPSRTLLTFNARQPVISILAVALILLLPILLFKKSRESITRGVVFLLLVSMIAIAAYNCFILVKGSTYKSDMDVMMRFLNGLRPAVRELTVWDDGLRRLEEKSFTTFPSEHDKWGDYYYLHSAKDITVNFVQGRQQLLAGLGTHRISYLVTNRENMRRLRALIDEKKVEIIKIEGQLVLLRSI